MGALYQGLIVTGVLSIGAVWFVINKLVTGPLTIKDMGTVMKAAMARFAAEGLRVDGKVVSEAVKKELAGT